MTSPHLDRADIDLDRPLLDGPNGDLPGRLVASAVRVLPAERRDWGRAMRAELATIEPRPERWSFARGCLSAAAREFHLLRGGVHVVVVLSTLATLLAWTATVDRPPLAAAQFLMVWFLAAAAWEARRAGMLGPIGDGAAAWLLRGAGYLIGGGIIAAGLAHLHPATTEAVDAGTDLLVLPTIAAGYLLAVAAVFAKRSAATGRVLAIGAGSGLAAALVWTATVFLAPPIPVSIWRALTLAAIASVGAAAAIMIRPGADRSASGRRALLAALLAATLAMALVYLLAILLASYAPDHVIPSIVPDARPPDRVSESRIEIIDPYVRMLVLTGLTAAALALTGVVTRRPAPVLRHAELH